MNATRQGAQPFALPAKCSVRHSAAHGARKDARVTKLIAETVPPPDATSDEAARGRYLARTTCAQCHGTDLRGASNPDFTSPSLQLVAAYSPEAFAQLMREGVALGGRNLRTMSPWALKLLSNLTDSEIAALYSYLHTMPEAAHN